MNNTQERYQARVITHWHWHGYFEVVDTQTGQVVESGFLGERDAMRRAYELNHPVEKLSMKDAWELMYS